LTTTLLLDYPLLSLFNGGLTARTVQNNTTSALNHEFHVGIQRPDIQPFDINSLQRSMTF
jgi:hypothetical protein